MLGETVIFRATDELAGAIQQKAEHAGLTVSEYLRGIISECVGVHVPVSPVCADLAQAAFFGGEHSAYRLARARVPMREGESDVDPFTLLACAAQGDTQAQRDLADKAILLALSGREEVDPFLTLSEGLIFARLADRHDDIDDAMRIITMLALASTIGGGIAARDMAGEAIARLEMIANGGSKLAEDAAALLTNCAARESAETMQMAKEYRDRLSSMETV